jgi:acyl-CoA synthetase (AMP-forming)/AMP-acid ligase II
VAGELGHTGLHAKVLRAAGALRALGLQPEQRVLMCMADSPEFVVIYLAAMRFGAVPVPVSTMIQADGLAEMLRDSRARLLVVTDEFVDLARAAIADVPDLHGVISMTGGELASIPWLEKPVAYVVPAPGETATEEELPAFCRAGLPSFKRPRKFLSVTAYPTTSTGKIRRVELREQARDILSETLSTPASGLVKL